MHNRWLDEVQSGAWETELTRAALVDSANERFEGDGFLSWTYEDGVQLRMITSGADQLIHQLFGPHPAPGTLLPDGHYLRLEGETHDGFDVSVERISPSGHKTRTDHVKAVWQLSDSSFQSGVVLKQDRESADSKITELLLAPITLRYWPRRSDSTYDNPHFGYRRQDLDWLEVTPKFGKVAVRQCENGVAHVRIYHENDEWSSAIAAVRLAFSFLNGRMANIVASESQRNGTVVRKIGLPKAKQTRNDFAPPFGTTIELVQFCEPLLTKAMDFFSSEGGNEIGNLLFACIDSVDNTFTNHALAVCTTLESLFKRLTQHVPTEVVSSELREKVLSLLRDNKCDNALVNRFSGFIGSLDSNTPKNILRRWAKDGVLNVTDQDVKAWGSVRDAIAHGRLLMVDEDYEQKQELVTAKGRMRNLTNKLILQIVGYEGQYFDYISWRPEQFPLADPSNL